MLYNKVQNIGSGIVQLVRTRPGFDPRQSIDIIFFSITSRPALEPIQLTAHIALQTVSLGVKRPRRESENSTSSAKIENSGSIHLLPHAFLRSSA
jgi:hypothetical protein